MAPKKPTEKELLFKSTQARYFARAQDKARKIENAPQQRKSVPAADILGYEVTVPNPKDYTIWNWALPQASIHLQKDTDAVTFKLPPFVETLIDEDQA